MALNSQGISSHQQKGGSSCSTTPDAGYFPVNLILRILILGGIGFIQEMVLEMVFLQILTTGHHWGMCPNC